MSPISSIIAFALILMVMSAPNYSAAEGRVASSPQDIRPLLNGAEIPDVTVNTVDGKPFKLLDEAKQKPSIVIFFRGGWCGYCSRQLSGIQDIEPQLIELGYRILAITPDKSELLQKNIDKNELTYTLLSDSKMEAAKAFGIAYNLDDEYIERAKKRNFLLPEHSGEDHWMLPVPSAYVIDTSGVIQFEYINPTYSVRVEPEVLLAAARAAVKEK